MIPTQKSGCFTYRSLSASSGSILIELLLAVAILIIALLVVSTVRFAGTQQTDQTTVQSSTEKILFYNVLDYGAAGDGVTDDSDAIQTAVNYIESRTPTPGKAVVLFFGPDQSFRVEKTIQIKPNSSSNAQGYHIEGYGSKILNHVEDGPALQIGDTDQRVGTFRIKGLAIDGDYIGKTGILFYNVGTMGLEDMLVYNHTQTGIEFRKNNIIVDILNCEAVNNSDTQIDVNSTEDNNKFNIIGGHYAGGVRGIRFNKIAQVYINSTIEGNTGYAVTVTGESQSDSIVLDNCWFENAQNGLGAIEVQGIIRNLVVRNCIFENVHGNLIHSTSSNWYGMIFEGNKVYNIDTDCFDVPPGLQGISFVNNFFPNPITLPDVGNMYKLNVDVPWGTQSSSTFGPSLVPTPDNIVINGDFSRGFFGWTYNVGGLTAAIDKTEENSVSGLSSAKLVGNGTAGWKGLSSRFNYHLPGQSCYGLLSFYAKTQDTDGNAVLATEVWAGGSVQNAGLNRIIIPAGTNDWQRYAVMVKIDPAYTPPRCLYNIRTWMPANGTVWIDDIEFSTSEILSRPRHYSYDPRNAKFYLPSMDANDITAADVVINNDLIVAGFSALDNVWTKTILANSATANNVEVKNRTVFAIRTFDATDTTPSVQGGTVFKTQNGPSAVKIKITNFDDGAVGQWIKVIFSDTKTIVDFTATKLKGNNGRDWAPAAYESMDCLYDGNYWYCQVHD